jgi:hypothetical protein
MQSLCERPCAGQGMKRYPDFYCVGAQKAGTTWLHFALQQHPGVWLPPIKELHYFDRLYLQRHGRMNCPSELTPFDRGVAEGVLNAIRRCADGSEPVGKRINAIHLLSVIGNAKLTDSWYGRIFAAAPRGLLCGEICPAYAELPDDGIAHIFRLSPKAKIIFIMRDPIERAWSHLRMDESRGNIGPDLYFKRASKHRNLYAFSDYVTIIERFRKQISSTDLLLLCFDDIVALPQTLLADTCAFLGLDPAYEFERADEARNAGERKEMPPEVYAKLRERLEPIYERLLSLDSPAVTKWYEKHYGEGKREMTAGSAQA